jgi:hypothetical protein
LRKQESSPRFRHPLHSLIYLIGFVLLCQTPWLVSASAESLSAGFGPALVPERVNVAAATNGGIATASSSQEEKFALNAAINGDRKGLNLGTGDGGWRDDTASVFPDTLEVTFAGSMPIDEINVITQQDTWWNPVEPTLTMAFFNNGITSFEVQFWNGSNWAAIPGGVVTGNNKVWRKFTFSPITTNKIRVQVNGSVLPHSTIIELEAFATIEVTPTPTPTPTPAPVINGPVDEALAAREIYFDSDNNVGFGTTTPVFNDDGITGANVGRFVAIDGRLTGAAGYLGLGGTVPTPGDRVGVLNFYNWAMGGADHRTAAIYSFNGPQLGTGNLEFYTSPNFIGPVRRIQISPTGEVGINHASSTGTMVSIMGMTADATTKGLVVLDSNDRPVLTVRSDGQIAAEKAGQGIVLKSPNGLVCRKLTINNSGELVVQPMGTCP